MTQGTPRQRLVAWLVRLAAWLACRLPARPLEALSAAGGSAHYALNGRRRTLVRDNLRRVCTALVATGQAAPRVADAARGERALERLVRAAFQHHARYYLELLRAPVMTPEWLAARLTIETPDVVDEAFDRVANGQGVLVLGLHLGAVELPAIYAAARSGTAVAGPMEVVANPALQAWFTRQRERCGIRVITPLSAAAPELRRVLSSGGLAGIVGDRDVTGGGRATTFFGAEAPLPVGPALLAQETGAPVYVAAVRRAAAGRYTGRMARLAMPEGASLRERVDAFLAVQAHLFESFIADAPEQWWTLLFPIWERRPATATSPAKAAA